MSNPSMDLAVFEFLRELGFLPSVLVQDLWYRFPDENDADRVQLATVTMDGTTTCVCFRERLRTRADGEEAVAR